MDFKNCNTYPEIMSLYIKLSALNEPFELSEEHSKEWIELFRKMKKATKATSKYMWPNITINPKDFSNYDRYRHSDTLIKILKYYKPEKGSFDRYFIHILRNDVYKHNTHVQTQRYAENRLFKLSKNAQKKINKCLSILKKYNREHPGDRPLHIYDDKAKSIFLENNVFKNEASMKRYLQLNRDSMNYHNKDKEDDIEKKEISFGEVKYFSKNAAVRLLDLKDNLPELFSLIDQCFVIKINMKKQNSQAQMKKEKLLKETLTCHYYLKYIKIDDFITDEDWTLNLIMKKFNFCSLDILNIFTENDRKIREIIIKKDSQLLHDIEKLSKTSPVTVEKISIENGKPYNYGYKVIGDFKKLLKKQATLKNLPEEIIGLI